MEIYIDESGNFMAQETKVEAISCVAALIIPESLKDEIFYYFKKILTSWNVKNEIKGSNLNESQIAEVMLLLSKYEVIIEAVCFDLGLTTNNQIGKYKKKQAFLLTNDLISEPSLELANYIGKLQYNLDNLTNQLYVQALALIRLIKNILDISISYYAQRIPITLKNFRWVIDAKGDQITKYEELFEFLLKPILQTRSIHEPSRILKGADYSFFETFLNQDQPTPNHMKSYIGKEITSWFDLTKIMENLIFAASHDHIGLQLVDIVANCIRRGMRGNLQYCGWKNLANLMIYRKNGAIKIYSFNPNDEPKSEHYRNFVNFFQYNGKPMLKKAF